MITIARIGFALLVRAGYVAAGYQLCKWLMKRNQKKGGN